MNTVIAWLANYLLYVMAAAAAVVWLVREDRSGKIQLAAAAVLGLLLTLGLIVLMAHLHDDPRPFVVNHSLHPLISHSADNGFPSDHSAAAALIATLLWLRNRWVGVALGVAALLVGVARVAAHVHHVQDIAAGFAIGIVAAWLATTVVTRAVRTIRPTDHLTAGR